MLIIERIEGDIALIEDDDSRFEAPRESLAGDVREGDVVTFRDGVYRKDENGTEERRKKIIEMQNELWE